MRGLWLAFLLLASPAASAEDSLVGQWEFFMMIYKGQEIPQGPDATLRLRYEFFSTGESRLYWWHEGAGDHCERRGTYSIDENYLIDRVHWVDPNNTQDCSHDPDMQNGRETRTPFTFQNGNWLLRLAFGEDDLFYVWKRFSKEEK